MSGPEQGPSGGEGGEQEASPERTIESEVQANIELWKDLGVEVNETDVREKIEALPEIEGFDWYLYVPPGIKASQLFWHDMKIERPGWTPDPDIEHNIPEEIDRFEGPRDGDESYAVAAQFSEDPLDLDEMRMLGKKSLEQWEDTDGEFTNPREYFIARMRYYKETGSRMDIMTYTNCCHYRDATGGAAPQFGWSEVEGKYGGDLNYNIVSPTVRRGGYRPVVTKDTSSETIQKVLEFAQS